MSTIIFQPGQELSFKYTNWRGIMAQRRVQCIGVWHGSTEYHPNEEQWFLRALDLDKNETRDFPIKEIYPC